MRTSSPQPHPGPDESWRSLPVIDAPRHDEGPAELDDSWFDLPVITATVSAAARRPEEIELDDPWFI